MPMVLPLAAPLFYAVSVVSPIRCCSVSLHSKRSRTKRTKFHISSKREKWGESKKVEGRGWGRGKKGTLARKPLNFEKRPLVFTVEFIN